MNKILVPSIPKNLFRKASLITQINEAFQRETNLILINAPAGYGKTYLMLDYAKHLSSKNKNCIAIWLQFEFDSQSIEDYFSSFITLLKFAGVLSPNFFYDENISLFKLMNSILAELENVQEDICFFLDDFQYIKDDKVIDALEQFLLNDNDSIKILLTSRKKLPFSLVKAFINDQVSQISHEDLVFCAEEIKTYSETYHRRSYSLEEAQAITDKTGGWPTVLPLNPDNFNFDDDYQELIVASTSRNLTELLYKEIIEVLSEDEKEYLSVLSICNFLSEPLIRVLIGDESINMNHLDNIPLMNINNPLLPTQLTWYTFQPLLRHYLENELKSTDLDLYIKLNVNAANWYLKQEIYVEAVEHFIKGNEFLKAIEILEINGINIIASGNFPRFKKLIQKLPYKYLLSNASLLMLQGWFYTLNYQHSSATATSNSMKKMLAESPQIENALKYQIIGLDAVIAHFSDRLFLHIDDIKQTLYEKPVNSEYMENSLRSLIASHYLNTNEFSKLECIKNESLFFVKGGSLFFSSIYLYVTFAMKEFSQGNLGECLTICSQTEEFMTNWCNETRLWHIIKVIRGMVAYINGELTKAKELFNNSGKIVSYLSDPSLLSWFYPIHIRLLSDLGLKAKQEELQEKLISLCNSRGLSFSKCPLIYETVVFYLNINHPDDALSLYMQYKEELKETEFIENHHLFSDINMLDALMLGAKGQFEQQQKILLDLGAKYESSGRKIQQLNCLVLLVNSSFESKNISLAKQTLKKIVTVAASQNLIQMLSKLRPEGIELLGEWTLSEWSPKRKLFMSEVCSRFSQEPSNLKLSTFQIEPLTQSEKKVMEFLSLGYSNKVIAEKLDVSINTIKFHLKVIFSKLGVSNRIQANLAYSQNKNQYID